MHASCRLQTILKRPGAYKALIGTDDKDEDTDQEAAPLLAPEPSSHQEGTEHFPVGQQSSPGNGFGSTSQLGLGSGSPRSQQAGTSTGPGSGPGSSLKPPAAAAQGLGEHQGTLRHLPEALSEASQVVALSPVDAELRIAQMAAALQVGSLFSSFKLGDCQVRPVDDRFVVADRCSLLLIQAQQESGSAGACMVDHMVAVSAAVADKKKLFYIRQLQWQVHKLRLRHTGACTSHD